MIFIDTHTHLYLNAFDDDREDVVNKAIEKNIEIMLLPNIDRTSMESMHSLCQKFPDNCFPMMGLHPTSVKDDFLEELSIIRDQFASNEYVAVGEIGIDLYWDKKFVREQEIAFRNQVDMALEMNLPVVIHSRESIDLLISILSKYNKSGIRGVFHCFTGTIEQAQKIIDLGFYLGIGGVLTFKNSKLDEVIRRIDLDHILLETDAPFLAPVPYRGKRNESAYIRLIARKLADIKSVSIEEVAERTTSNARDLFGIER